MFWVLVGGVKRWCAFCKDLLEIGQRLMQFHVGLRLVVKLCDIEGPSQNKPVCLHVLSDNQLYINQERSPPPHMYGWMDAIRW